MTSRDGNISGTNGRTVADSENSSSSELIVGIFQLQCDGLRGRSKVVELWSGAAQYCLLVGNYNSATVVLEALEAPAITRLQNTVSYKRLFIYDNSQHAISILAALLPTQT